MKNITQEQWREFLESDENAVIIDTRTPNEWRTGVFKDSILMDINNPQEFMDKVNALETDKNYYVYCQSGVRSIRACQVLESIGVKTTYNLLGGISVWTGDIVKPEI